MCKIKDLDRNEVYSLEEIKKDSVKFDMLKEWLKENDKGWTEDTLDDLVFYRYLYYPTKLNTWVLCNESKPTKCALILFELDITDYQVDCSKLSKDQIEEMAEIVKSKGFDIWNNEEALITDGKNGSNNFFKYDGENYYIGTESNKVTITYNKFIELFGEKEQWIQSDFGQYKLTEQGLVFHNDFDFELYKELGGLNNKPIEQAVEELSEAFEENTNDFKQITDSISDLLDYKNTKYGNSALEPLNIFTNKCKAGQRLDDKLARVKNSSELKKNDVADLIGYLILTCKENNWTNFDEFKD